MNTPASPNPNMNPGTAPPEAKKSLAKTTDTSDPGPFQKITAQAAGSKVLFDSQSQAWSGSLETGNAAYSAALARAISRVNDDFDSRRPKEAR